MNKFNFANLEILFCFLASLSLALGSEFPEFMLLQHSGTLCIALLAAYLNFSQITTSFERRCILGFMLIHAFAARWIYSYVPYDHWSQELFGITITQIFNFQRNHFDRLVHFSFGLLFSPVAWRFFYLKTNKTKFSSYLSFEFITAFSVIYELFEWILTLLLSSEASNGYNGQQGDPWDAHKDMAMAMLGSLCALWVRSFKSRSKV